MFRFSITHLGLFLGKSPVTLRAWERKGLITLSRVGTNRSMTIDEVRAVSQLAHSIGRISDERLLLILDALGALTLLEWEKA